jgi:hypothetical protein
MLRPDTPDVPADRLKAIADVAGCIALAGESVRSDGTAPSSLDSGGVEHQAAVAS